MSAGSRKMPPPIVTLTMLAECWTTTMRASGWLAETSSLDHQEPLAVGRDIGYVASRCRRLHENRVRRSVWLASLRSTWSRASQARSSARHRGARCRRALDCSSPTRLRAANGGHLNLPLVHVRKRPHDNLELPRVVGLVSQPSDRRVTPRVAVDERPLHQRLHAAVFLQREHHHVGCGCDFRALVSADSENRTRVPSANTADGR